MNKRIMLMTAALAILPTIALAQVPASNPPVPVVKGTFYTWLPWAGSKATSKGHITIDNGHAIGKVRYGLSCVQRLEGVVYDSKWITDGYSSYLEFEFDIRLDTIKGNCSKAPSSMHVDGRATDYPGGKLFNNMNYYLIGNKLRTSGTACVPLTQDPACRH